MSTLVFRSENPDRLAALLRKSRAFTKEQFDPRHQGIPSMPPYADNGFSIRPDRHGHPRVLFTKDRLAEILRHAQDAEAEPAADALMRLIETEESGILPPMKETPMGVYTLNNRMLLALQAKALAYQLSGNREYGLEALVGIRNYLLTMKIRWLRADICRHFGFAMYVAACVYDWCFDLTDEDIRYQIICGVAYSLCIGETEGILKAGAAQRIDREKMEIGFPPCRQNAVTGHGCELQLMRDYLSFAIAIYGEVPSWWQYVGNRFYTEFPPVRRIYFEAGIYPQGTNYAPFRMLADAWVSWLLKVAVGEIPFHEADMKRVMPSLFGFETHNLEYFRVGDDYSKDQRLPDCCGSVAMMFSWLFDDPGMKAWAKFLRTGYSDFGDHDPDFHGVPGEITPAEFLILNANGIAPLADRHEGMPMIQYNGGFYGNVLIRNTWADDAAMAMMKGLIRSTANHDHHDAATFQIAYKGLKTGDSGVYETYSSPQHFYYHQATLAHNGILVYNPEWGDNRLIDGPEGIPINRMRYYYSGGQRVVTESGGLEKWLTAEYDMSREIGHQFGYFDTAEKDPEYAYYAVDYTQAYPPCTVDSIRRHMLTVYTRLPEVPMLFFVYDDIRAKSAAFRKAFLLQCPAEPVIDRAESTITLRHGAGKLVLKNLLGGEEILAFGAPGRQFFNPKDDPETNGINIPCMVEGAQSEIWGHAEIVAKDGGCETAFGNVLYVTDRDLNPAVDIRRLSGERYEGVCVRLMQRTIVFIRCGADTGGVTLPVQPAEDTQYYIAGLAAGEYDVMKGAAIISRQTVAADRPLAVLGAGADVHTIRKSNG